MATNHSSSQSAVSSLSIPFDRDLFLRNLLRELTGTLEEVIGLDEAAGFISVVGQHIGEWMNSEYLAALEESPDNPELVADILVDLKQRIGGDFRVVSIDKEKIVLGNRACPFGDKVVGRTSLCMMTSNVFGMVTAENLGYAKICLDETIAQGCSECKVTVYFRPSPEAENAQGNEYYRS